MSEKTHRPEFLAGRPLPFTLPDGVEVYLRPITIGDVLRAEHMDNIGRLGYIASRAVCDAIGVRMFADSDEALDGIAPEYLGLIVSTAVRRAEQITLTPLSSPDAASPSG